MKDLILQNGVFSQISYPNLQIFLHGFTCYISDILRLCLQMGGGCYENVQRVLNASEMCEVERKQEMKKSEIDGCATSLNGRDGRKEKVKVRNISQWRRRKKKLKWNKHFSEWKRWKKKWKWTPFSQWTRWKKKWKWKQITSLNGRDGRKIESAKTFPIGREARHS